MKLDRNLKLLLSSGKPGITVLGPCAVGHTRRCARTDVDPGVCMGQFNQNCTLRYIQSIGRFCLFAPEVLSGGAVHPVSSVSTHLFFQNMDNGWNQDFHTTEGSVLLYKF